MSEYKKAPPTVDELQARLDKLRGEKTPSTVHVSSDPAIALMQQVADERRLEKKEEVRQQQQQDEISDRLEALSKENVTRKPTSELIKDKKLLTTHLLRLKRAEEVLQTKLGQEHLKRETAKYTGRLAAVQVELEKRSPKKAATKVSQPLAKATKPGVTRDVRAEPARQVYRRASPTKLAGGMPLERLV